MGTFSNTFVDGMKVDIDPHLQKNTSYRYAMGGRLAFNRSRDKNKSFQENVKSGNTLAFVVARGTRYELSLPTGYKVVGSIDTLKGTVIFSTNGEESEIGWLELNDNVDAPNHAKYFSRFNDRWDPNYKNNPYERRNFGEPGGDQLNFNEQHYIHGFSVYENEFAHRIYWVDGYNQKRTLNLNLFFDDNGNPYHVGNNPADPQAYPKHLSTHAFEERMDLVPAVMKFQKRIPGQLKSGVYRLCYQYVSKNGHSSVWSELSPRVFVTDQKLDGDLDGVEDVYKQNHHNRTMGGSNIMTTEGLQWELKGVDTRWDYIRVAYVYHATSLAFQECNAFAKIEIGFESNFIVKLDKHTGTSVTKAELNQAFQTVMSVGTTAEQENRTWDGNVELLPEINLDLKGVVIKPLVNYIRADNTLDPTFQEIENKVSGRKDNDPLTNTGVVTTTRKIQRFTGQFEDYMIDDDFDNYKGQQVEQLLKGYYRGETYGFAIVLIDRKGNPTFVQHIQDFTFPNMYDGEQWTLTRESTDGRFDLRILGATLSNITIPANILYDKFGKLNISGFKIVRTERSGRIANQGIIVNTVETPNGQTENKDDIYVQPQLYWDSAYIETPGGEIDSPGKDRDLIIGPNSFCYLGAIGTTYKNNSSAESLVPAASSPGIFNYHSPDLLIEQKISQTMIDGQMHHVGFVHSAFSQERVDLFSSHYYTKSYRTLPIDWPKYRSLLTKGRPRLGAKSRIKFAFLHDKGPLDVYEDFDPEQADKKDFRGTAHAWLYEYGLNTSVNQQPKPFGFQNATSWHASLQPNAAIVKLLDFKAMDIVEQPWSRASYRICNWIQTPNDYFGDENNTSQENSSLEKRRYMSTGHMQPITEDLLEQTKVTYDDYGKPVSYTFNDVEIYGGDCYVNLFDFSRLYPQYTDCVKFNNAYPDYSTSLIVPNESKYNLALLYGRRFAANAVTPQRVACTGSRDNLANGINPQQPEDWNYNEVLLLQESTKFYFPKPADTKILTRKETGGWYSPRKIYGELEDSYRQKLVDDYWDAIGQYGAVQMFGTAFDGLYMVQESAFGLLRTSLKTLLPTAEGEEIYVKSGDVFGGIDYKSKDYGTQHKNSFWYYGDQMGFFDARMGKLIVFAQNGFQQESDNDQMSDPIMALSVYFDKPIIHDQDGGKFVDIIAGYDRENSSVYTSFIHQLPTQIVGGPDDRVNEIKSTTIEYNREAGFFHGYQPVSPYIYIRSGRYLLAPSNKAKEGNRLYLFNYGKYGHWFDKYYDTELEFIINPQPNVAKLFNNGVINVNFNGYDRIARVIHEVEENIHIIVLAENDGVSITHTDDRAYFMESALRYPMHEIDIMGEKARLRGHYLTVRIVIDNSQQSVDLIDKPVAITNFDSVFQLSYPNQYGR